MVTIRIVLGCVLLALVGLVGCSPRDAATTGSPGAGTTESPAPAMPPASAASN